jgi:hypothetical protein
MSGETIEELSEKITSLEAKMNELDTTKGTIRISHPEELRFVLDTAERELRSFEYISETDILTIIKDASRRWKENHPTVQ